MGRRFELNCTSSSFALQQSIRLVHRFRDLFRSSQGPTRATREGQPVCTQTHSTHTHQQKHNTTAGDSKRELGAASAATPPPLLLLLLLLLLCFSCCWTIPDPSRSTTWHSKLVLVLCFHVPAETSNKNISSNSDADGGGRGSAVDVPVASAAAEQQGAATGEAKSYV